MDNMEVMETETVEGSQGTAQGNAQGTAQGNAQGNAQGRGSLDGIRYGKLSDPFKLAWDFCVQFQEHEMVRNPTRQAEWAGKFETLLKTNKTYTLADVQRAIQFAFQNTFWKKQFRLVDGDPIFYLLASMKSLIQQSKDAQNWKEVNQGRESTLEPVEGEPALPTALTFTSMKDNLKEALEVLEHRSKEIEKNRLSAEELATYTATYARGSAWRQAPENQNPSRETLEGIYRQVRTDFPFLNQYPPVVWRLLLSALKLKEDAMKETATKEVKEQAAAVWVPPHPFTDRFLAALMEVPSLDQWVALEPIVPLPIECRIPVTTRQMPCPLCHDTDQYLRLFEDPAQTMVISFIEQCICLFHHIRWTIFGDPEIVPLRFRSANLAHLKASSLCKMTPEKQLEAIQILQAFPLDCYFIYGPAGTGKTHLSLALLEHAITTWAKANYLQSPGHTPERTIFRVSTKTWVDQMFAYKYAKRDRGDDEPTPQIPALNVAVITNLAKKPGMHICVIFDEIDKFGATDARLIELFEIVNKLSEVGAQLICTSNHSPQQLMRRWKSEHTEPILRRFCDNTGKESRRLLHCTAPSRKHKSGATQGTEPSSSPLASSDSTGDPLPSTLPHPPQEAHPEGHLDPPAAKVAIDPAAAKVATRPTAKQTHRRSKAEVFVPGYKKTVQA
jgi:hypothetical protein